MLEFVIKLVKMTQSVFLSSFGIFLLGTVANAWAPDWVGRGEPSVINHPFEKVEVEGIQVWRSGKIAFNDTSSIAVEISIKDAAKFDYIVYVFDSRGAIQEVIDTKKIDSGNFWTDFIFGNEIYLEVHGSEIHGNNEGSGNFIVTRVGTSLPTGNVDMVVDGMPKFNTIDDENIDFDLSSIPFISTARLIVGQNNFPLKNNLPNKNADWCTGFLISQNLMMTAGHCFKANTALCKQTVALFGYDKSQSEPAVARACKAIEYLNPYIDVAIIRLFETPQEMTFTRLSTELLSAEDKLIVVQHPYGSVRLISADAACKVIESGVSLQPSRRDLDPTLLQGLAFSHGCDTLEGSSGSPVFSPNGKVVGLHQGGMEGSNKAARSDLILKCITIEPEADSFDVIQSLQPVCQNSL